MLRRVIKVGGSLLDWAPLPRTLDDWLTSTAAAAPTNDLLLVGGGRLADAIRELDQVHHLDAELAHELAVECMRLNSRWLARRIAGAVVVGSLPTSAGRHVGDPVALLAALESRGDRAPLPRSWSVTSDSIAAWLAQAWGADELWLLKSTSPASADVDPESWSRAGLVDPWFFELSRGLPTRLVNLRAFAGAAKPATPATDRGRGNAGPRPRPT